MESKCDVEGCEEKATQHVTDIAGGKIVTAHVCIRHARDISSVGKTFKAFRAAERDPVVMAKLATLLVQPLCQGLLDDDAGVRAHCAWLLAALGEAAFQAIPTVRNLINDPDAHVREAAQRALEWIDPSPGTQF
ncbi:MAG TPA: HEAT repeat domain-containing protein [Pirellulales bacterium]|jgi:hypothetical protein|nr:HEAT repeat domain-containing protein [Pirellulales bacterium]